MIKKIFLWGGVAFLLFFIAYRPDSAADVFQALGSTAADIAQGLGDFVTSLIA
ncbi:hypothetical protein GCM10022251_07400 [Phytohabitans flavus]|uniref:Uncharacterized protein n=1 Tax=Phytohabitans flavus TaxID=1076124 RepID=A0A6F8Y1T6_9ACTN|nr:hypothetical protein [Phytohabitans flavus]BCB80082.1 hypothetical protein Pflav_064920 [Phytohabitans flavus]